jgi:hypothetical protein
MASTITLTPADLETYLVQAILHGNPTLVTGAPGIGKTDILTAACIRASAHLILSFPSMSDPTDSKGMPWIIDGAALFIPFGEVARVLAATEPTVWFWDEFGQATSAVQAAYMPWLRAREVNGHRLPDCVTIMSATNRRTDRAGVAGLLEPIKSRFVTIVELEAHYPSWRNWALDHNQRPETIAYLDLQPDAFNHFSATADLTNSPSPRTWSHVSRIMDMDLPSHIQSAAICGAVGEGAGVGFNGFLKVWHEMPSVDGIILNPDTARIPDSPSALYAVSSALAFKATPQTFQSIVTYANRLLASGRGEFGVLAIKDSLRRCPAVENTAAFVRMTAGDIGKLYTGTL